MLLDSSVMRRVVLISSMLQALSEHLEAVKVKLPKKEHKVKESQKSERALVEARVHLLGALFKMDHHPMEVGST